jgi:capsular polysaccharide transport system permease protein
VIEAEPSAEISSRPRRRPSAYLISFILCVLAPAFAASLYFALFASDQFAAEARFAVRSAASETGADKLKSVLSAVGSMPAVAGQDSFIIASYVKSRAIVDELSKTMDLREIYRRPEADFWARLPNAASAETLTKYWDNMVSAYVDGPSGIVTLRVRAFRRDDAFAVANAILKASETLANSISMRARQDMMKLAEGEVASAEARVLASLSDLRHFREQAGFIDPTLQATSTGALLTELLGQKIKLQNNYFVATSAMSPEAPTVQSMKARLDELDRQIDEQKALLTSKAGTSSLASQLPKFEELELQNQFAEKLYAFAQDGLERARLRAESQSLYVSVFEPPALPEEAKFPERFGLSAAIGVTLLVLWGIGALIAALIEDHRL